MGPSLFYMIDAVSFCTENDSDVVFLIMLTLLEH